MHLLHVSAIAAFRALLSQCFKAQRIAVVHNHEGPRRGKHQEGRRHHEQEEQGDSFKRLGEKQQRAHRKQDSRSAPPKNPVNRGIPNTDGLNQIRVVVSQSPLPLQDGLRPLAALGQ